MGGAGLLFVAVTIMLSQTKSTAPPCIRDVSMHSLLAYLCLMDNWPPLFALKNGEYAPNF